MTNDATGLPKAVAAGKLLEGVADIDCYVLEDGRRVLSQRSIVAGIIGGAGTGDLARYVARIPGISKGFSAAPTIRFQLPGGGHAFGREASFLVKLCQAYVAGLGDGSLHSSQITIANRCAGLLGAFAQVGIEALVDEATGYQALRDDHYLSRRLKVFLREEAAAWEMLWPPYVVKPLARVYGIKWESGIHPKELQRAYGILYDVILGADVAREMRVRNIDPSTRNHQYLQDGARKLASADLRVIATIANQSQSKADFWARIGTHFKGVPLQLSFMGSEAT